MDLHISSENPQIPVESQTATVTAKKKSVLKPIIIIGAVVLLAAVIVILLFMLNNKSKKIQNYAYIKDSGIYISAGGTDGVRITHSGLASCVRFSENKDRVFWINGSSLFYVNTENREYKYEKIADNSEDDYVIDKSGDTVVYRTVDGDLQRYSAEDGGNEKIGTNVLYFENSADLSRVAYITNDNELFVKNGKDEAIKIDSDYDIVCWYVNDSLDTIVYMDELSLFKWALSSGKSEKIDTNVTWVAPVCFDGNKAEAFYTKVNNTVVKYWDYVNDDLADSDAAVKEPVKPTEPENLSDDNKTNTEYENAYNKYLEDYQKYSDKIRRDELRKELKEADYTFYSNDLYLYNGNNTEKKLTKLIDRTIEDSKDLPYPAVRFLRHEDKPETSVKMNMSEINDIYDVGAFIDYNYNDTLVTDNTETYFASEKTVTELFPGEEIAYCEIADDCSAIYCMINENTQEYSLSLYKITLSDGAIVDTKKIATGLSERYMEIKDDNKALYFKYLNEEKTEYEVYIDEYPIDNHIVLGLNGGVITDKDNAFYFADYDSKSGLGTLKCRKLGGDIQVIGENVWQFQVYDDGSVLFVVGRSTDDTGDLYLYNGADIIKLDDNVTGIAENYSEPWHSKYIKLYRDE